MVEEVVNKGNFDVVDEIFHPDYVDHVAPPGTPPGLAGVEGDLPMFRTGFPDVKFTIDQMIGEGNYVATLVHGEGTHTGQFIAVPAERQARASGARSASSASRTARSASTGASPTCSGC